MHRNLAICLVVLFLGNLLCLAQSEQKRSKPTTLVLEVIFHKEKKPTYQTVFETTEAKGNWYGVFERVPDWRQPEGSLPVRAVNVVSRLENDAVTIKVSVFTGQKLHEKEEFIADYALRENQRIAVKDLTRFGVEPFEIAVVRLTPTASALPRVENKSESVTVAGLEPVNSTIPSYKLILANNSKKAVKGFSFMVTADGKWKFSGMPQELEGKSLIEPGGMFEKVLPSATEMVKVSAGQPLPVQSNQVLTILAVIFEDGSFEGEAMEAARLLMYRFGRKIQIKRIIALLQQAAETDSALDELGKAAANLKVEIDEDDFNKFINNFAALTDAQKSYLRISASPVMQRAKMEFITELENLNKNREKSKPLELRGWLDTNEKKYQAWLSRL